MKAIFAPLLLVFSLLLINHCRQEKPQGGESEYCVSDEEFFQKNVYKPVIVDHGCLGCHAEGGGAVTDYGVTWALEAGQLANFQTLKQVALREHNGKPMLLVKPTLPQPGHAGGIRFDEGSEPYQILAEFVERSRNPTACVSNASSAELRLVKLYDMVETLNKASLGLVGRLPTSAEEKTVYGRGSDGLREVMLTMMQEQVFYQRLSEMFNDLLLTDKFFSNGEASQLILEDFADADWYRDFPGAGNGDELTELGEKLAELTEKSLAREPLELINYVVKNDRPFTEILTADYTVVNAYSARSYGVNPGGIAFKSSDVADGEPQKPYHDFRTVKIRQGNINLPHAGILTTPAFLARYPNSNTNVNRHRARYFFLFFLNTDILALSEQISADGDLDEDEPTLRNSQCTSCHNVLDPVAGLFKNFSTGNRFEPRQWYDEQHDTFVGYRMLPPGMSIQEKMPEGNFNNSLQYLARQTAKDPRFARSIVNIMFKALTGNAPLGIPSGDNARQFSAYQAQEKVLENITEKFMAANYNLKTLIIELVLSPYFRAKNANQLTGDMVEKLSAIGVNHLLTPEQLNRKVSSILGSEWQALNNENEIPYLLDRYRLLYGGIDSDEVTSRASAPNAILTNIQMMLSVQMACQAVPRDFTVLNRENRLLMRHVELAFQPEFADGSSKPDAIYAIKKNIRLLHKHLLAEELAEYDNEIDRTYQLFYETYREYRDAGNTSLHPNCRASTSQRSISNDQYYTLHAWMAVVAYLMQDYRFLYN